MDHEPILSDFVPSSQYNPGVFESVKKRDSCGDVHKILDFTFPPLSFDPVIPDLPDQQLAENQCLIPSPLLLLKVEPRTRRKSKRRKKSNIQIKKGSFFMMKVVPCRKSSSLDHENKHPLVYFRTDIHNSAKTAQGVM